MLGYEVGNPPPIIGGNRDIGKAVVLTAYVPDLHSGNNRLWKSQRHGAVFHAYLGLRPRRLSIG